jgi:hypothetical protein
LRERLWNFFRRLGGRWVSPDEAWMSPAERAFVEERPEDRDADQIVAGTLGGLDPKGSSASATRVAMTETRRRGPDPSLTRSEAFT